MAKFPGGTPGRWEKIAHELGRSVSEVSLISIVMTSGRPIAGIMLIYNIKLA